MSGVQILIFEGFHFNACLAALSEGTDVDWMCDIAYVSGMVTSHANALLLHHGISLAPSGLLLFWRTRPVGSL